MNTVETIQSCGGVLENEVPEVGGYPYKKIFDNDRKETLDKLVKVLY